ncbi:RNA-binding protein 7-like [Dreissena polymorpha]|uniref:RRM domain-containing protein n=1 Tax=Dreissena polymorpha TaxID=45954 RepID=A0A9D4JZD8_DREPO|nr:RNA-binding protein 7-like [Dreissena polymorpha]KAH3826207.1 hypothetical protein DPMN_128103 [Dreissena polymorpha]
MSTEVDRTLWVGNLSDKVSDELLYELFLQAGPLERVSIAKEKDGRPKGFAFITFAHDESVPYTVQLMDGIQLFGRVLKLQFRPGSSHQQQQQQHQRETSLRNPHHHSSPIPNSPHMLPNMNMNVPVMNIMNIPLNPYMNNQPMGVMGGQMSPLIQQSHPPNFQRSNTWHGGEGSGSEGEYGRADNRNSRGHHGRKVDQDKDRSGYSDRDRSHSRNRNDGYHNDRHGGGGGGSEREFEAKRQRVMEKTNRMKQSYQHDSHGSHGQRSHGQGHRRGGRY